ncbi:MAG: Ca-activated chloride channel family protein [Gammaproteobacteria bacterium]|jgi:Ca-activated chloride channel family protein
MPVLQLDWPWALLFLPLPLAVYFGFPARSIAKEAALWVPFLDDFKLSQQAARQPSKSRWLQYLSLLAWCLMVLAASRPEWLGDPIDINISGRDLMLAVDLSDSMGTEDFKTYEEAVDRLTATKSVMKTFIENRKGDRLGLILFGSQAYLQTPMTFDTHTVNRLLQEAAIGLAGEQTAIGDAIGLALKRLANSEKTSRVLILVTDGANTAGEVSPIKAAELAADKGLKIYTIGIGADELIRKTWFGEQKVNPSAQLDEKALRGIADITGGRYFRARDTSELVEIYDLLDELEPVEQDDEKFRPTTALFYWPLAFALCLGLAIGLRRS